MTACECACENIHVHMPVYGHSMCISSPGVKLHGDPRRARDTGLGLDFSNDGTIPGLLYPLATRIYTGMQVVGCPGRGPPRATKGDKAAQRRRRHYKHPRVSPWPLLPCRSVLSYPSRPVAGQENVRCMGGVATAIVPALSSGNGFCVCLWVVVARKGTCIQPATAVMREELGKLWGETAGADSVQTMKSQVGVPSVSLLTMTTHGFDGRPGHLVPLSDSSSFFIHILQRNLTLKLHPPRTANAVFPAAASGLPRGRGHRRHGPVSSVERQRELLV